MVVIDHACVIFTSSLLVSSFGEYVARPIDGYIERFNSRFTFVSGSTEQTNLLVFG